MTDFVRRNRYRGQASPVKFFRGQANDFICGVIMIALRGFLHPDFFKTITIKQVPRQSWGWTPMRQIMTPLSSFTPIRAGETAYSALERMVSEEQSLLPVMEGNRFVGLVRQENLLRFAQTRSSLGG